VKLRLARKISRWCNPSLADIDGVGDIDLEWINDRRRRYRGATRRRAAAAMARHRGRHARQARKMYGPLVRAYMDIIAASNAPALRPEPMSYCIQRTLLTMPPRRHFGVNS
jgi:hypothetical protein